MCGTVYVMPQTTPHDQESASASLIHPIWRSVRAAGELVGLTTWEVRNLCESDAIVSRFFGLRRLVDVESLLAYIDGLPTERPSA